MSARRVGLVAACADPRLIGLGAHPAQRELLALIEGHRTVIAACGRRFGKTRAAAAAALHNLLLCPGLDGLVSVGEKRYAVSVANSAAQARIFVEHAAALVKASPILAPLVESETADELRFVNGTVLAAFPCTAKGGRGWPISFLCLDEFAHAFALEEGGPQTAERLWAAMTPSVAQFGELGRIVVTSTPLGSDGTFAELYAKARNGEIPGAAAFHAPTEANPLVDREYLAGQEAALGYDDYRREFGAEFIAGGASFLEASRVRDVVADRRELRPEDGKGWVCGFDPSFSADPAAVAVVGYDPWDSQRLVVGHVERWLHPRPRGKGRYRSREEQDEVIERVLDGVAAVAQRFKAPVVADQHLPGLVSSGLARRGIACTVQPWTPTTKTEAFQAVRARIYTGRIELPDEPVLVAELCRLRTKLRAGSATVETPKTGDSHCDAACALAAAVYRLDRGGGGWGGEHYQLADLDPAKREITAGLLDEVF